MTKEEVLNQIQEIFRSVLSEDNLILQNDTTADNIDEWDSLNHIQLIVAIEKHFKIRFSSSEIQGFKNVGEMCDSVLSKY
tara:strand:+ start:103 stop:342 length:240 start_codon:yes stop_codon:yes gene_type:complete